jgi:ABC-2 type transport system permease protein
MTSTTAHINLARTPAGGRVTQLRVARSEWTKLRSLRSTVYALLATAVLTIGFSLLGSAFTASGWSSSSTIDKASFNPLNTSLSGVSLGVLAIGVLGVLIVTGEYSTGMVRSTFTAVPTRLPVLLAKAGVYFLVALAVAVPATLIAFFGGQALLSSEHLQISFADAGVARAVFGAAGYLALAGLIGLGLGSILRNTAAAIASLTALIFVIPPLIDILPSSLSDAIGPYLPSNAGEAMMRIGHQAHLLSPAAGLAVLAGYAAATLTLGALLLLRRDV